MRKDVYERMKIMKQDGIKPNYTEIARRWNCDALATPSYNLQPHYQLCDPYIKLRICWYYSYPKNLSLVSSTAPYSFASLLWSLTRRLRALKNALFQSSSCS